MLRRCLTWLRATWVVRVLPLDQNVLLHQIVGYAILFFTVVHTMAHVFNFGTKQDFYSKPIGTNFVSIVLISDLF